MNSKTLERIERWYALHCNGDWEHQYGVRIDTIDNPGWQCVIDLADTSLEDKFFAEIKQERTELDWIHCRVREQKFEGFGGPTNLGEILDVFLDWAEMYEG
ncbi:MAG: rhodanese-related sulfurtransferase [Deltaproteobacteria bacterium]|nr:MAG: rhodanese-related sulfurtransferase [Deltaproteobacteria bacterium]